MEIKDRIIEFLKSENISSSIFAQQIGVQPSGISHIISGRNKPSLDFIVKMLSRYPSLSSDWLLFGKGKMLKENIPIDLFSNESGSAIDENNQTNLFDMPEISKASSFKDKPEEAGKSDLARSEDSASGVKATRIVIFNSNNTFTEYFPG